MMDEDRRERSDRLSQRFDRDRDEDQGDDATEDDEEGAVDEMERNEDIEPLTQPVGPFASVFIHRRVPPDIQQFREREAPCRSLLRDGKSRRQLSTLV